MLQYQLTRDSGFLPPLTSCGAERTEPGLARGNDAERPLSDPPGSGDCLSHRDAISSATVVFAAAGLFASSSVSS